MAASCACAEYPHQYAVGIAGFTPEQTAVVVDAIRRWETAVDDPSMLRVTVRTDECTVNGGADVCVTRATALEMEAQAKAAGFSQIPEGSTERDHAAPIVIVGAMEAGGATIRVSDEVTRDGALSHVVQHELGHAFGLSHTGQGTVMYPTTDSRLDVQRLASQDVAEADVAQYTNLRQ
jgi:Matrixin